MYKTTDIAREAALLLGEEVCDCVQITTGMTNLNFKIKTPTASFIFRVPGKTKGMYPDYYAEMNVIAQIKAISLDVETVFFDVNTGRKITRLVTDKYADLHDNYKRAKIGSYLLRTLHHSNLIFNNRFSCREKFNRYEFLSRKYKIPLWENYREVRGQLAGLQNYLEKTEAGNLKPCHNDMVPGNILMNEENRTYLIDWEYAGMNSIRWDLAAFCLEHDLSPPEEQYFLNVYYKGAVSADENRFMLIYKILQDILWSLWAMVRTWLGDEYLAYAKGRYERGINNLKLLDH